MKLSVFGLMLMLFLAMSCDKEVITSTNHNESGILWSKELTDGTESAFTRTQFPYYNSTVVYGGTKNNQGYLIGLDIATGEQVWEYENEALSSSSGINMEHTSQRGANTYFLDSPNHHYFVDIENGNTIDFESSLNFRRGERSIDDRLFKVLGKDDIAGGTYESIVEISLNNPEIFKDVACPDYNFEHTYVTGYYGYLAGSDLFVSEGDTMMLMGYLDSTEDESKLSSYWGVYNLSKEKWGVKKEPIFHDIDKLVGPCIEHEGLYYFACPRKFVCWDPVLMEELWSKDYSGSYLFIEERDLLLLSSNFGNELHALNTSSGNEYWTAPVIPNSPLHYQDDVLYFVGAGTGHIHALDITNGSEIWKIRPPDSAIDSNSTWSWQINGIPAQNGEKGKIFASSYLTGYCFEAVN